MFIAQILDGVAPGNVLGSVTTTNGQPVTIICRKLEGNWTPQYGLKRDEAGELERFPLPPCFVLEPAALEALVEVEQENS